MYFESLLVYILVNCHRRQIMSHLSILFILKLCNKMRKGDILYENDQLTIFQSSP